MPDLTTRELKVFLPAKDFELSSRFYADLGFEREALGDDLACFSHGPAKFLLQRYYVKAFAESLMMHLLVDDVDAWWQRVKSVGAGYAIDPDSVCTQPWGLRDFAFLDPAGVAWRIAQEIADAAPAGS